MKASNRQWQPFLLSAKSSKAMGLVSQPIAVAAEVSKSKLVADPGITVMELYQSIERWMCGRGTNDLVALLQCVQCLDMNDSPTKFGPVFLELEDLLMELIQLSPNCMLPRKKFIRALEKLNADRQWNYAQGSLYAAACDVDKHIRTVLAKLRDIGRTTEVFNRFLAKATLQERNAVDSLMGHMDLRNSTRGSAQVFQQECLQHDDVGLSLIFEKFLNGEISRLKPSDIQATVIKNERKRSSMETLSERKMSRTSSVDSLDALHMDDFEHFPVYCMSSGTVANNTEESCEEFGTGAEGNDSTVTPDRKRCKLTEDEFSEQKATKLPDLKFMSDGAPKSSGKISTALATTPPRAAATRQKKGGKKPEAKSMEKKLVYNRAYKRRRQTELQKGSSDEDAKKVAAETARNAVKFFVEKGEDV